MNDDDLERSVASALHECFPDPAGSQPRVPAERIRPWPQIAAVTGTVAVVAAAGITISLVESEPTHPGPPVVHGGPPRPDVATSPPPAHPTSSPISSPGRPPVPHWVARCLPRPADQRGPAAAYVGLTYRQAVRLAGARGEFLVLAGSGGRCDHSSGDVYRPNEVALVFDGHFFRRHPNAHRDPRNPRARIIAAVHATPGWDGAHR